eukprot:CAMPEP_0175699758 /NCGR_PEP_ID=MMETSP0097-20121207/34637_1 /TAXON_ID=311494 /ORGANISM="Alexandrium monilatum, Strain CCMP3105" /LENGTH=859 /DNA_ID=CAMNT_0017006967 /DNA_START=16 /DNA_END=2595 /DNA_ORIENTATION=+
MDFTLIPVSKDSVEWQCSILRLGGVTVLLNCGWSESFDTTLLAPLIPYLNDLDLIILTHADIKHVGALPYLLTKYPIRCPVIATEPVSRLGELSCVSCLEDREKYRTPVEDFEVDDVLRAFMSRIRPVNYRETFHVHARGRMLSVCPYPAGMHLGSAYWVLQSGGHSIAYLVDCSLRRGRYLDGLELQRQQAPQELSVASKALKVAKNVREQLLLEETIATLRRGGSVLIPADVVGWLPEVLLLLEAAWAQDRQLATSYPLVWLSSLGDMVLDQVKTRLEYMSKEVLGSFEARFGQNPFVLKNIRIFQTLEELCAAHPLSRPKVILATSPHLEGGDSRELLMRICAEPRTLLWILGVPPAGTLAHSLLDDFVLRQCSRKDYRLQQHLKQALPDDQLRAYYEAKLQELSETGQKLPFPPAELGQSKQEDLEPKRREDGPDASGRPAGGKARAEPSAAAEALGFTPGSPAESRGLTASLQGRDKGGAGALWSPLGWPACRTLAHSEWRSEGDEYGHLLTPAELRAWRAQDQEGSKCSAGSGPGGGVEGSEVDQVKEEAVKMEDDVPLSALDSISDWRDSLSVHFREPMHFEVRERTIRVACRVRFLPDSSLEPQDLSTLVDLMAPRHVVLLPSANAAAAGAMVTKNIHTRAQLEGASVPEVHALCAGDAPLELSLRGLKRKAHFAPEVWPKLSFLKTADGIRMARVQAAAGPPREGADPRVVELGSRAPPAEGDGADAGDDSPSEPLPRHGAFFVGLSQERLSLSSLKEQLRGAEWAKGDLDMEFCAPGPHVARPWSSRVLAASGAAALGWARGGRRGGGEGAPGKGTAERAGVPVIRLEGLPGEEFFLARAALYRRCALL